MKKLLKQIGSSVKAVSDTAFSKALDMMDYVVEPMVALLAKWQCPFYLQLGLIVMVALPPVTLMYIPLFFWYAGKTIVTQFNTEVA